MQKHRIYTNIGIDQKVTVELKQEYDLLEILSLKFSQQEAYSSFCGDYGVVCGRITVNNGFGVPNARVSIFIPISETDEDDPVISRLYPYKLVNERNDDGYRYNLLPSRKQHGGHEPTGTFPDQKDILGREEVLEVYEKYYKYTVKTNIAGDFMIWGVPLGQQELYVDVDLSDIGCFSLRPYDFIRNGSGVDEFKSEYEFKGSTDIDSLPQIVTFSKTVEVYPFWGNQDLCEIGITRTDFDLSTVGVKIEPKAFIIGGTFSDTGKNSVNKNCRPRRKMGRKCDLTSSEGTIEALRYTTNQDDLNRPIIESVRVDEDIDETGSFLLPIDMNMDFVVTNEFGENEYSNDPNKGIATAGVYRFRFTIKNESLGRVRTTASYLVPNIREYSNDVIKSYAWSTEYGDYPTSAIPGMLNNEYGSYYPEDYFYRFTYGKVYTVSSFQNNYFRGNTLLGFGKPRFVGIKELDPPEEEDCSDGVNQFPINFGIKNYTFNLLIADVLLLVEHFLNLIKLTFFNTVAKVLHQLANAVDFWPIRRLSRAIRRYAYRTQDSGQKKLYLIVYPECDECNGEDNDFGSVPNDVSQVPACKVGTVNVIGNDNQSLGCVDIDANSFSSFTDPNPACSGAIQLNSFNDLYNNQDGLVLRAGETAVLLNTTTGPEIFIPIIGQPCSVLTGYVLTDPGGNFSDNTTYVMDILEPLPTPPPTTPAEQGCSIYDTPYDEDLAETYYVNGRTQQGSYGPGDDVESTEISDRNGYALAGGYEGDIYGPITEYNPQVSGFNSEFSNGVFYIIPGTQSNGRLWSILREFRRRKRVAKLFCGGIVNYAFIDNWLSGSLYFFAFKAKNKRRNTAKFCGDIVRWIADQSRFYYRSCSYNPSTSSWGYTYNNDNKRLNTPTTFVDLGPRDEFIKEICTDPMLDVNCSVSRQITSTSFKPHGELLGLVINYRLDVSDNQFSVGNFFNNGGFGDAGFTKVLDGDIMQLISINNEVGIEGFDLQNPKYLGYSYQYLDPEQFPNIFKNGTSVWGPTPITLDFSEDGVRQRLCLNQPTHLDYNGDIVQGRLTEASQKVPFFLWDKKGTGFGAYDTNVLDDQSWDYTDVQVQPLQGMTFAYKFNYAPNDTVDKYLLPPITYTNNGVMISTNSNTTNEIPFEVVSPVDDHVNYDTQYPGFQYLHFTSGTLQFPTAGTLWTRVGSAPTWHSQPWTDADDFIIKKTEDYYNGNRQILSTPFMFYFGLRPENTGLDKLIQKFGPSGAFPTVN
jgi:hypothetical protein